MIVLAKPIKPNEFIQFIKINAWNGCSHTDDDHKYIEMKKKNQQNFMQFMNFLP